LAHRALDLAQARSINILHDDEVRAAALTDVIDARDVRMNQLRRQPRLVEKCRDGVRIFADVRQGPLERHLTLEAARADLPGEVDLRHATGPDALLEVIAIDLHLRARALERGAELSGDDREQAELLERVAGARPLAPDADEPRDGAPEHHRRDHAELARPQLVARVGLERPRRELADATGHSCGAALA